jgi:hypothetical protein
MTKINLFITNGDNVLLISSRRLNKQVLANIVFIKDK